MKMHLTAELMRVAVPGVCVCVLTSLQQVCVCERGSARGLGYISFAAIVQGVGGWGLLCE